MAPSRKSRSINEVSSNKTGENANKSRQKKRKLSDMLGPQWSKQELERFYEAYRKHGKDWRKVATEVRNRSVEMIEALYTMNRAYLSLPEGTASVVGLIATLTDHYRVLVIPNVQKRLYSDDEPLKAKISSYGNTLKAIETIKTKLTVTQMQEFQKTCFGHFLNMQKLEHQGHVIHHLGLSMVECDDDAVMEFNFGGTGARFTDRDFALVTGLNFIGDIEAKNIEIRDIRTNNIQTKYLNKSSSIWTDKLLKYFEDADYEEDNDAVKMALLYFLNCGLIGVARKTNIDMSFVRLVEDLDKFNEYPWGAYLYKLTVQALNDLFGNSKVRNASGTCDIKGFPLAFQVWAYEAIPKLGEDGFAKRVKVCTPRMLGWRATDHPSYKDLKDKLFGKKNYEVLWTLIPNEEELKKEYMTPWKNGHRKRRCRAQPIVEQYVDEPVVDTAADQSVPAAAQSVSTATQSLPSSNDHNRTNMGMILERLDRVEQRLDKLQSLCLAIFEKLSSQAPTHDPPPPPDPSPSTPRDPSASTSPLPPPPPPPRDPIAHIDHSECKYRY